MDLTTALLQYQNTSSAEPVPSTIPTTSIETNIQDLLKAVGKEKLSPILTVLTFTPSIRKKWCSIVKSKIKVCSNYIILHNNATGTLMESLVNIHPEENSSLSERFIKATDSGTKTVFTVDEQLIGYHIFKLIDYSAFT